MPNKSVMLKPRKDSRAPGAIVLPRGEARDLRKGRFVEVKVVANGPKANVVNAVRDVSVAASAKNSFFD